MRSTGVRASHDNNKNAGGMRFLIRDATLRGAPIIEKGMK